MRSDMKDTDISKARSKIEKRYNKNLAFFKEHIPIVYKQLVSSEDTVSLTLDNKTKVLNKVVDGVTVYPGGAFECAQKEVADFINIKHRFNYKPLPSSLNVNNLIKQQPFLKTATLYANNFKTCKQTQPVCCDVVVFGVGLGHHIEILCNKGLFHHITVIEKNINNLKESLYTINWYSTLKDLKKDRRITFVINDTLDDTLENRKEFNHKIKRQLFKLFPSVVSSTIIYNHNEDNESYEDEKNTVNEFKNISLIVYERIGPDGQRLLNTNENVRLEHKIVNLTQSRITDGNIVITGAGPSLDLYKPILKKYRDKYFIISSGSSITTLLNYGITPDLHFELEFQNLATEHLKHLSKTHKLSDIELICSIEANPGILKLFKKCHLFLQETSDLSTYFTRDFILRLGGITCTNGATAFANRISNSTIHLVGVDFAYTNGHHHTKDNISNQRNLPPELEELETFGKIIPLNATVKDEDVFGNEIMTSPALSSAKQLMEILVFASTNNIINCSHGAKIPGTKYCSAIDFEENSKKLNRSTSKFIANEIMYEKEKIHELTKKTFEVSFDVCNQITDIVNTYQTMNGEKTCIGVQSLLHNIINATKHNAGQSRNVMSINRLPLLILYNLVNYSDDDSRSIIIKSWLDDYNSYVSYIKDKLFNYPFDGSYHVKEDWIQRPHTAPKKDIEAVHEELDKVSETMEGDQ